MEKKELSTPNPHVDGGKGKKAIVYNTKEKKKKEKEERKRRGGCTLKSEH